MNNSLKILLPAEFMKMNSMPDDPANSFCYGKETSSSNCFLIVYPINAESAMPFDNIKAVIDGIHSVLDKKQGLIEVQNGITNNQKKYVYSIIKSQLSPSGVQYALTMHIDMNDYIVNIQSYFDEKGITGQRDAVIMEKMIREGKITPPNLDSWMKDPYNDDYKKGLLMNLSEQTVYDIMFPQHPLTETRNLIKYIVEHN